MRETPAFCIWIMEGARSAIALEMWEYWFRYLTSCLLSFDVILLCFIVLAVLARRCSSYGGAHVDFGLDRGVLLWSVASCWLQRAWVFAFPLLSKRVLGDVSVIACGLLTYVLPLVNVTCRFLGHYLRFVRRKLAKIGA